MEQSGALIGLPVLVQGEASVQPYHMKYHGAALMKPDHGGFLVKSEGYYSNIRCNDIWDSGLDRGSGDRFKAETVAVGNPNLSPCHSGKAIQLVCKGCLLCLGAFVQVIVGLQMNQGKNRLLLED